jgi:hypothetical protein
MRERRRTAKGEMRRGGEGEEREGAMEGSKEEETGTRGEFCTAVQ